MPSCTVRVRQDFVIEPRLVSEVWRVFAVTAVVIWQSILLLSQPNVCDLKNTRAARSRHYDEVACAVYEITFTRLGLE